MRRVLVLVLAVWLLGQPACIWKLWKKGKPPEEKKYDVTGTVVSTSPDQIVVQTKEGTQVFIFDDASIKGGDLPEGTVVHVYFRRREEGNVVFMVVKKIK